MALFAMIHTRASSQFTALGLGSFFKSATLRTGDRFVLLDNDGSFERSSLSDYPLELLRNESPMGFAANGNQLIKIALQDSTDLYLLNNDIVFTPGWSDPLRLDQPIITSPLTNREVQYHSQIKLTSQDLVKDEFKMRTIMGLAEYETHEHQFQAIADLHRRQSSGLLKVLVMPYCCVRLPRVVMERVGMFDESFGPAGAEDYDYSLRATLAGFNSAYALGSLVLHFGGQSSWAGGETRAQTDHREKQFKEIFRQKWGEKLYQLIIMENSSILQETQAIQEFVQQSNMLGVVEALLGSLKPKIYL